MADAADSKSAALKRCVGSSPTFGIDTYGKGEHNGYIQVFYFRSQTL
jgi:hypothetical protein